MKRRIVFGIIALVVLLGTYVRFRGSAADERARTYFALPGGTAVTSDSIRTAVLQAIPLGSTEAAVEAALSRTDVGKDGLSKYYPPDKDREAVVRIEYDLKTVEVVKVSYGVIFRFGADHRLRDVSVREWLAGW